MRTNSLKHLAVSSLIALSLSVAFVPLIARAATYAEYQAAIEAARQRVAALPLGSPKTTALRQLGFLEGRTEDVWNSMTPQEQDAVMGQIPRIAASASTRTADNKKANEASSSCVPVIAWDTYKCLIEPILIWTGSIFLKLGGYTLLFGGSLFDMAVQHVVIDFKSTLESLNVLKGVESGWTLLRDIVNILIIAVFVFIAISLILGLKAYGQKKMIARVLVIATLINFSLLFTKIIIDTSNFFAYAVYKQTAGAGTTAPAISSQFVRPMGITSIYKTDEAVAAIAKNTEGGAFSALVIGLVGGILFIILAIVLIYGAFLIVARAVLLILLMIYAPLAFFTYLVPHFEESFFGWKGWWKTLINNAAFAPLLMLLLSIAVFIVSNAPTVQNQFGDIAANPERVAGGWVLIMVYIVSIGLLFLSFKIASSLSGSISSMRLGTFAAAATAATGFRVLGGLGERTFGRASAQRAQHIDEQLSRARIAHKDNPTTENLDKVLKLERQKAEATARARRSFNFMNTGAGKALAGAAGLKGPLTGESKKGGYQGKMEDARKEAVSDMKATKLTDDDKKKIREEAMKGAAESFKGEADTAAKNLEAAKKDLEAAENEKATIEGDRGKAEKEVQDNRRAKDSEVVVAKAVVEKEQTQKVQMEATFKKEMERLSTENRPEKERIETQARHTAELQKQEQRIKEAHEHLQTINVGIEKPLHDLEERIAAADRKIQDKRRTVTARANDVKTVEKKVEQAGAAAVKQAEAAEKKNWEATADFVAKKHAKNDPVGAAIIRSGIKDAFKKKNIAEIIENSLKNNNSKTDSGGTDTKTTS